MFRLCGRLPVRDELPMLNQSGIYEILNTVNGKRYIGSAVKLSARWNKHRGELRKHIHHNAPLQQAWDKYGEAAFKFLPILTCARSMLYFYEQQLLDKVKPEYNVSLDAKQPMLGRKHSEETKQQMSRTAKSLGKIITPEHRVLLNEGRSNTIPLPRSAESRARTSKALKGKTKSVSHRKALSEANMGKKRTPAQIEHLRQCNIGRTLSDGAKKKISESKIGKKRKPFTDEAKANMSAARRRENAVPGHALARAAPLRGRKHSDEHTEAIRAGVLAFYAVKRAAKEALIGS